MTKQKKSFARVVILGAVLLLLLSTVVVAQYQARKPTGWYTVEPWEVEVCKVWGGRASPQEVQTTEVGLVGYGPFTHSALAKKIHSGNNTLYVYAYYVQSYAAELQYSVDLYDESSTRRKPLASGTLGPRNGVVDRVEEYLQEEYTHIRVFTQFGSVSIPIVEARE
jgi:hypothetical protein